MQKPETAHRPDVRLKLVEAVDIAQDSCDDMLVLRDFGRVGEGLFEGVGCGHCKKGGSDLVCEINAVSVRALLPWRSSMQSDGGESEGCVRRELRSLLRSYVPAERP